MEAHKILGMYNKFLSFAECINVRFERIVIIESVRRKRMPDVQMSSMHFVLIDSILILRIVLSASLFDCIFDTDQPKSGV